MSKPIHIVCNCGWSWGEPGTTEDQFLEQWNEHRKDHPDADDGKLIVVMGDENERH